MVVSVSEGQLLWSPIHRQIMGGVEHSLPRDPWDCFLFPVVIVFWGAVHNAIFCRQKVSRLQTCILNLVTLLSTYFWSSCFMTPSFNLVLCWILFDKPGTQLSAQILHRITEYCLYFSLFIILKALGQEFKLFFCVLRTPLTFWRNLLTSSQNNTVWSKSLCAPDYYSANNTQKYFKQFQPLSMIT
jgi:hypothetical protein